MASASASAQNHDLPFAKELFEAADRLRGSVDRAARIRPGGIDEISALSLFAASLDRGHPQALPVRNVPRETANLRDTNPTRKRGRGTLDLRAATVSPSLARRVSVYLARFT